MTKEKVNQSQKIWASDRFWLKGQLIPKKQSSVLYPLEAQEFQERYVEILIELSSNDINSISDLDLYRLFV